MSLESRLKSTPRRFELPLFATFKEALLFLLMLLVLCGFSLGIEYKNFLEFKNAQRVEAKVLNHYKKSKNSKEYYVLKLKLKSGNQFYTTSRENLKILTNREISLKVISKNVKFLDFISSFYAPSYSIYLLPKKSSLLESVKTKISNQHSEKTTKELFGALYFADPISKELRDKINLLGVAHLVALSGFHLGVILSVIFLILLPPYRFFQKRYFTYRNAYFDIAIFATLLMFSYLYIVDFVPSLLRAFGMFLVGFLLYIKGIKVLSFTFLFSTLALLIALKPSLFFSIGFLFSAYGVFLIYLTIHHFSDKGVVFIFFAINSLLYFLMLPLVHYYFTPFSPTQLLSIPLTMVFTIFYPLSALLHILNIGSLFDSYLISLFSYPKNQIELEVSPYFLLFFVIISLISIFSKRAFMLLIITSLILFLIGIYKFLNLIT